MNLSDFFASYLTRSTLLFAILKINNRKPYPRWRTARRPKGDRGTKCRVKERTREETCTTWLRSLWTASLGDGSEWDRKRSSKINLNAYLYRFPTVFGKYIRILDQVRKIRQFHSIPFEFQGFKNRPQICFLPFHILYCKPILRALSLLVCGL